MHLLVAFLAAQVALGVGGKSASKGGALQLIAEQPGGAVLLWLVVVGLTALAVWQAVEAVFRPVASSTVRQLVRRAAHLAEALLFILFAMWAARLVLGAGSPKGEATSLTARVPAQPFGRVLVIAAGLAVAAGLACYGM